MQPNFTSLQLKLCDKAPISLGVSVHSSSQGYHADTGHLNINFEVHSIVQQELLRPQKGFQLNYNRRSKQALDQPLEPGKYNTS